MTVAGIHDGARPPTGADLDALAEVVAAAEPGATVRRWRRGSLALAWTGGPDRPLAVGADGSTAVLVDGTVWDTAHDDAAGRIGREGAAAFPALRGDFVAIAADERRRSLLLGRDQLGGRSLVWHEVGGRLRFATEARDVLSLLPSQPPPDPAALAHWLSVSGMPDDHTLYAGVHRLLPAHVLQVGSGSRTVRRYWAPVYRRPVPAAATDRTEAVAGLRAVVAEAVRRRSDGPATAVLLSGGLDSSSVAAMATELADGRRPTLAYSATFPDHPTVDEADLIDRTCSAFTLSGTKVVVRGGSVLAGAIEYLEHWKLPPHSPNLFFWLPLLRRAADDGVRSMLDGEGGDEVFGLSPYLMADRLRRGRVRAAADLVRRVPGGRADLPPETIRRYLVTFGLRGALPAPLHTAGRRLRGRLGGAHVPAWLRPELAAAFFDTDRANDWKRMEGPRWWAWVAHAVTAGMGINLTVDHVRRRAAIAGIQPRHPLVDPDVIEYVLGLDPELAFDPRHSRPLLREAVAGRLPDEVRLRFTKSNFDAVFHAGLAGPDLPIARHLLDPATALLGSYVDLGLVERSLLRAAPEGPERQRWAIDLWRLVSAECWLRSSAGSLAPALEGIEFARAELSLVAADR